MCGRIAYDPVQDHAAEKYNTDFNYEMSRYHYRSAFLPGEWIYGVVDGFENKRVMSSFLWGFDPMYGSLYNARIETASQLPTWRDNYAERRCIVPIRAFYEQGHQVISKLQPLMNVCGIYAKDPRRISILTQDSRGEVSKFHNRMPVIVPDELIDNWLDHSFTSPDDLKPAIFDFDAELIMKQ